MKYMSKDGKTFDTERECREHEKILEQSVKDEKLQKDKDWEEVVKKKKAYEAARIEYIKALSRFNEKYRHSEEVKEFLEWLFS